MWRLGNMGHTVFYEATENVPKNLAGPSEHGGITSGSGAKLPTPTLISCEGPPPVRDECSCVHVVACAACHPSSSGAQTYYPGASLEMKQCRAPVTHMEWLQLAVKGAKTNRNSAMLMSG